MRCDRIKKIMICRLQTNNEMVTVCYSKNARARLSLFNFPVVALIRCGLWINRDTASCLLMLIYLKHTNTQRNNKKYWPIHIVGWEVGSPMHPKDIFLTQTLCSPEYIENKLWCSQAEILSHGVHFRSFLPPYWICWRQLEIVITFEK